MLYDPKWESEIKTDPFELNSLIAWLEKQPPKTKYEFYNCEGKCLLGQYMASLDIPWSYEVYWNFRNAFAQESTSGVGPIFKIGASTPHTFGAALERARASL